MSAEAGLRAGAARRRTGRKSVQGQLDPRSPPQPAQPGDSPFLTGGQWAVNPVVLRPQGRRAPLKLAVRLSRRQWVSEILLFGTLGRRRCVPARSPRTGAHPGGPRHATRLPAAPLQCDRQPRVAAHLSETQTPDLMGGEQGRCGCHRKT